MNKLQRAATELNWILRENENKFPEEPCPTGGEFACASGEEILKILCRRREVVKAVEYQEFSGDLLRRVIKTMSDNVYPGRYAKNSYLILSCRSDSGMDDCRHARKMKYRRWRIERKNHEIIQKYRKNSLKRGGHHLLLTEIRLLNSFGDLKKLTLEELALSIRHVEKFGDHRDGSKPFSIIAHLCVHFETVLSSAILVKENQIKIKKENTKFKKIANNLVFLAEKFGPEITLREALERLDGENVVPFRKAA